MDTDDRENKAAATFDVDDSTTNTTLITSVEKTFEGTVVPPWKQQLTIRAFVVSFVLSILFTFIVMKLNLTTGIIPSLNVSAGLLGFFFVKTWTKLLEKSGYLKQPFTRQENTVIQTCVVASSGIAFSGEFIYFYRQKLFWIKSDFFVV
ncbi:probable metal-nicotianamine transporter YSL5 [Chenopodium quinoa]|uniref:probable metal-nicotianamine transporter YSL5 n=1 Tax=Chenopodium quinoa TaxID=63459 RepID=UPI000B77BC2F|nr:probable metal-nicotianamine transporter YSL5 [Chenopodium quinoa]